MRSGILLALCLAASVSLAHAQQKEPVYVGSRACGECHGGEGMGNQYTRWLWSKHARAYLTLAKPEAREIARISGIIEAPQKAPICLGCHAPEALTEAWERDPGFRIEDGMQCESCHGPGSEYMPMEVMRNREASMKAGLKMPGEAFCMRCHIEKESHKRVLGTPPFDVKMAMQTIAHPTPERPKPGKSPDLDVVLPPLVIEETASSEPLYKTPLNLTVSPDGRELYVACEGSNSLIVIDTVSRKKIAEIPVGVNPADVGVSPDGKTVYVSNRHDDTVSILDTKSRKIVKTFDVGDEPHGVLTDQAGKLLYVLNTSSDDAWVFDTSTYAKVATISTGRRPWALALSPDGQTMLATNSLSQFAPLRTPFASEMTAFDASRAQVRNRIVVGDVNLMLGVDWHPSGRYALATMNRTKSLVPMTRLMQGWTITNGLAVIWRDGTVDQILLDEPNLGFADVTDVVVTPDGKWALATSATTDRLAVVDLKKLEKLLANTTADERTHILPNSRGSNAEIVSKYIPVPSSPRGIAVAANGKEAYVANSLDDSVSVIDLAKMEAVARVDLEGPKEITKTRWGERLFHNAKITFQRQFACHSCHPDGHVDGVTYDIEADGIGISPVDNRTLRGIQDTAPFKWEGTNPSLKRQCGPRLAVFFTRVAPFTPEELDAVDTYITTIPRPPNRFHAPGSEYTEAQRRGRAMFFRTHGNDGKEISPDKRCSTCHNPPYYTDRQRHDVGNKQPSDRQGSFDVPHLNNIYDSAPYLHNGMAATLEEIWTVYNPYDTHGVTNDMTKDQLNDLIEFLKTL